VVRDDAVDDLLTAHRADAARCALAAGFDGAKFHREARLRGHVNAVIEYHYAAVADHGVVLGKFLVSQRCVEQTGRHVGAQWPADLHRTRRPAAGTAAAEFIDQMPEGGAEWYFVQAWIFNITGQLYRKRATG